MSAENAARLPLDPAIRESFQLKNIKKTDGNHPESNGILEFFLSGE
jgi:hypothetical protein